MKLGKKYPPLRKDKSAGHKNSRIKKTVIEKLKAFFEKYFGII